MRLVPAQDGPFSYTRSHFSALQNCALFFSIYLQFIFIFKKCITQFSHLIVSCAIFFKNIVQLFINFTHSFVAIELLNFCKNAKKIFYCSIELSLFWLNKQYSLCRKGSIEKLIFDIHQNILVLNFDFSTCYIGEGYF